MPVCTRPGDLSPLPWERMIKTGDDGADGGGAKEVGRTERKGGGGAIFSPGRHAKGRCCPPSFSNPRSSGGAIQMAAPRV